MNIQTCLLGILLLSVIACDGSGDDKPKLKVGDSARLRFKNGYVITGEITKVRFDNEGKFVTSDGQRGTIKIWPIVKDNPKRFTIIIIMDGETSPTYYRARPRGDGEWEVIRSRTDEYVGMATFPQPEDEEKRMPSNHPQSSELN